MYLSGNSWRHFHSRKLVLEASDLVDGVVAFVLVCEVSWLLERGLDNWVVFAGRNLSTTDLTSSFWVEMIPAMEI